ncbi:MAG: hypothetical protein A2Y55_13620 [Actinobacteria bacterium RBG_16_68_12]|nr:MAG: hypothetical protein A2Y55_13620 [Actinobacteria bacterium RBG_16_68_12]
MLGASFKRIQFTPDTTPVELNGQNIFKGGEQVFVPGAAFTNVLLADEINRTPPRTQAALFEPMQERQVTVDGRAYKLPDPFLVIATQNPHENEGVYPLPEGQLDRFLFKIVLEYADAESEFSMLNLPHNGIAPDMLGEVRPLLGVVGLDKARQELETTEVPDSVGRFIVAVCRRTRELPDVELGVSSRAMIHLVNAAKANARLDGRGTVTIEDVRDMAPYVLRHRIIVKGDASVDTVLLDARPPCRPRSLPRSRLFLSADGIPQGGFPSCKIPEGARFAGAMCPITGPERRSLSPPSREIGRRKADSNPRKPLKASASRPLCARTQNRRAGDLGSIRLTRPAGPSIVGEVHGLGSPGA